MKSERNKVDEKYIEFITPILKELKDLNNKSDKLIGEIKKSLKVLKELEKWNLKKYYLHWKKVKR